MKSSVSSSESRQTDHATLVDRRTWACVMIQALIDLGRPGALLCGRQALDRDSAMQWFRSPSTEMGSYRWICAELGLPADRYLAQIEAGDYSMDPMTMSVSPAEIRDVLARTGVTVSDAARELGMSRDTLSSIVSGRTRRSTYGPMIQEYIDRLRSASAFTEASC